MNKKEDIKKITSRIKQLAKLIKTHNIHYRQNDKPKITDSEFDKLNTQKESIKFIDEICKIQNKCPQHKQILGHNHYSMMYHFNTEDDSIANDILIFLNSKLKQ